LAERGSRRLGVLRSDMTNDNRSREEWARSADNSMRHHRGRIPDRNGPTTF